MKSTSDIVSAVTEAMASVISAPAVLHEPEIAGNEWTYVKECLDTGWVSTVGAYVDRFERDLAAYTGAGHAVATVNGTAALHACLVLAGVRPGDEVLIPTLTFVATANAVAYCGAIPHMVEADPRTLGLDVAALRRHLECQARRDGALCVNKDSGRPIRAVVPMHTFGHPVDMEPLLELAAEWGLMVVEDAAESLGSTWHGHHCGTFAPIAALSFNGNKIVTTGGGGAILTADPDLAKRAKHITTTAKQPHPWLYSHDQIGFNYRLPNVNAAIGCAQLERLDDFLARKRRLAESYRIAFASVEGVSFLSEPEGARSNYWLNAILLDQPDSALRDAVLAASNQAKMMTRPVWTPMHQLEMYRHCPRMELTQAESIAARLVNLPSSPKLSAP